VLLLRNYTREPSVTFAEFTYFYMYKISEVGHNNVLDFRF